MKSISALFLLLALSLGAPASAQPCVWGSFDGSRIINQFAVLTGGLHQQLGAIIGAHGGVVAPATPTLTTAYLSTVDVFYTSGLANGTVLSPSEQSALQAWIAGGGTLVVTVGPFGAPFYDTFTQPYGVTNFTPAPSPLPGVGLPVAVHPITAGLSDFWYVGSNTFTYGPTAQLLGQDASGQDFLVVLEPQSGFSVGGRVVVVGNYGMFSDSYIGKNDNLVLATNIVQWACANASTCPGVTAQTIGYGSGWPGTNGVPSLTSSPPSVGAQVDLTITNSAGVSTVGYLLIGASPASTGSGLGGVILVNFVPALALPIPLFPIGMQVTGTIPADPSLCGQSIYLQVLEVDAGASHGVSFTPGLALDIGP